MARPKATDSTPETTTSQVDLVKAFVEALNATKAPTKKTFASRKANTPWTPKDGEPQLKLKRKIYHHGLLLEDKISNAEINLMNQIKPGVYCDGFVKVNRRRDKGIDIDYPIKTASHRLKLINQFGIRSFEELLQTIVTEGNLPKKEFDPNTDE